MKPSPASRALMRMGGSVNYEPNSLNGPVQCAAFDEPPLRITGDATRYDHRDGNDDYTQGQSISINELEAVAEK
jgi:catalase